jgi:hypothetical protein
MLRKRLLHLVVVLAAAGLASVGAAHADGDLQAANDGSTGATRSQVGATHGFYERVLAPHVDGHLDNEIEAAIQFAAPGANPWTQDVGTVSRVEKEATRAAKGAIRNYAIEQLGLNAWSVPLFGASGSGVDALKTSSGGARLLFGFSHLAPRAEILVPCGAGQVSFSADATGRLGTSFQMPESRLRFGASYDPGAHDGTFSLSCRF